jgi:hypothetical protein
MVRQWLVKSSRNLREQAEWKKFQGPMLLFDTWMVPGGVCSSHATNSKWGAEPKDLLHLYTRSWYNGAAILRTNTHEFTKSLIRSTVFYESRLPTLWLETSADEDQMIAEDPLHLRHIPSLASCRGKDWPRPPSSPERPRRARDPHVSQYR